MTRGLELCGGLPFVQNAAEYQTKEEKYYLIYKEKHARIYGGP